MNIRQTKIATGVVECQTGMIEAQLVQYSRLKIVYLHRPLHHMETEVIGTTDRNSRADTTTRHPHRERLRMMIATLRPTQSRIGFNHWRAAKLAAPHHEGFVEHATRSEVGHQGRAGLIGYPRIVP